MKKFNKYSKLLLGILFFTQTITFAQEIETIHEEASLSQILKSFVLNQKGKKLLLILQNQVIYPT